MTMVTLGLLFSRSLDPDAAYLLLVAGLLAVLIEILHPGGFVAGAIGAVLLIVAGVILSDLPVNELGLALIAGGIALLLAEAFLPGGVVGALGLAAVLVGGALLYDRASDVRVSPAVLIGVGIGVAAFGILVLRALMRTRHMPASAGAADLVGQLGIVERALDPDGVVRAGGESWTARAPVRVEAGARVRVARVDGFTLEVEPLVGEETG